MYTPLLCSTVLHSDALVRFLTFHIRGDAHKEEDTKVCSSGFWMNATPCLCWYLSVRLGIKSALGIDARARIEQDVTDEGHIQFR